MKIIKFFSISFLCTILLLACDKNTPPKAVDKNANSQVLEIESFLGKSSPQKKENPFNNRFSGRLVETINASTFTFIKIKTANDNIWAAGPITTVKLGDKISFGGKTPMENFYSKSLNRTFNIIYFVNHFAVNDATATASFKETTTKN